MEIPVWSLSWSHREKNIRYQRLIAFLQYTGLRYGKFGGHCLIFERVQMQKDYINFFHELLPSLSAFLFKYDIDKTKGYFLETPYMGFHYSINRNEIKLNYDTC